MSSLTITWTPNHHGWAFVEVADDHGEAQAIASYITDAPEQFLYAVTRLVLGDEDTRAEFEGEPQVYRWFFHRDGTVVDVRLILADDARAPDSSGTVLWSGRHTVTAFARSAVRAFDRIDYEQGEESYEAQWGRPFPRAELEALRTAMRAHQRATAAEDTAPGGVPMSGSLGRRPAVRGRSTVADDDQRRAPGAPPDRPGRQEPSSSRPRQDPRQEVTARE
ncbi:hypothetical protein VSS38_29420 [Streptomyces albogriseolus]|uniref:hypothetical protein n=1 Tax=Streptomyces albogriseolus TaxID=1887 RepID=UPI0035DD3647